jgi:hypothetical protein
MNLLRCSTTAVLLVAAVSIIGCKSKQDTPGAKESTPGQPAPVANGAAPEQKGEALKTISGQNASAAVVASPQDKADSEAAALRVLAQMEAGEFSAMYQKAAPSFKKLGSEAAFVGKFAQTRASVGPLKGAREASFATRPDQSFVLVYHQENERFKTERRLTFVRGKDGEMELYGLNQHDEPKKLPSK